MNSLTRRWTLTILFFVLTLGLLGCGEEIVPRSPNSGGAAPAGGGSGQGPGDVDADADGDVDGNQDGDGDGDAEPRCELAPLPGNDPQRPCCFDDLDCQQSGILGAESMRCYLAQCRSGGEGVCLFDPRSTNECWTAQDCEEGQVCENAFFGTCNQPILENAIPGTCR